MFSLSNVIRKVTRFTEELFSVLISVIFIYQALNYFVGLFTSSTNGKSTFSVNAYHDVPSSNTNTCVFKLMTVWVFSVGHGEAKAGLMVGLCTFASSIYIKDARNGPLFNQFIRNRMADFAPVIAIFLGLGLAW
jgi:hypothetical protein